MKIMQGLEHLARQYDGFIVDLWGVVHDGVAPYQGALDCLARLQPKPVLLLSNAPRRADAVEISLRKLGVAPTLYTGILTSGEATWQALRDRSDPEFASLGVRVYHIGPERDRGVLADLDLERVAAPSGADFVLNTGPDDSREFLPLSAFTAELDACLDAHLPMICANPDLEIVRGGERILCAGTLATYYEARGGSVIWIGKPYPAIYTRALSELGLEPSQVLAIGDSLRTDAAGAQAAGIASAWVLGGIHAAELGTDPEAVIEAAMAFGVAPVAALPQLSW